ncbi:MAG: pentapeptide repeat-containing protein [Candidatus Latescibacterota bacterium]|nr:pentapeptide repeat-containing protein [Candidatus Latescibacterota bacterium]
MAVSKHLETLNLGTEQWNEWRGDNPRIRPVLSGANLQDRDFSGIDFLKVNLSGANLKRVRFHKANLRYTDFSGCDLSGADFENADIMLADLTGAKMSGVVGLSREQIEDTLTDTSTILPESLA